MAGLIQWASAAQMEATQLTLGELHQCRVLLEVIAKHRHRIVSRLRFDANPKRIAPT
jgi:hypothetical protein